MSNNSSPLFAIIIPVYNVKDYIRETVKSVISQSFDDFEVLLVDDGSTDGSDEIVDELARNDVRIRTFHQQNSGVSAARNLGLDMAKGEWIVFVDGDDAIKKDTLKILADCILKHPDVDMIGYDFERVTNLDDISEIDEYDYKETLYDCSETICMNVLDHYMVWGETVKRDLLGNLRFENLKNGEDVLFCNSLACRSNKYLEISSKLYLYLQRESSARVNVWSERRLDDYTHMNNHILRNLMNCNKDIDQTWMKRWVGNLLQFIPQLWQQSDNIQKLYFSHHRDLLKKVKHLPSLPLYIKLWITVATSFNSKSFYKLSAMKPMSIYSKLANLKS